MFITHLFIHLFIGIVVGPFPPKVNIASGMFRFQNIDINKDIISLFKNSCKASPSFRNRCKLVVDVERVVLLSKGYAAIDLKIQHECKYT